MATTSPPRRPTPPARRFPAASSPTPTTSSIAKGATARSAVSPRVNSTLSSTAARRASLKATPPSNATTEDLSASLKLETEQKENLLVRIQDKEQTITSLSTENDKLTSSLHAAETRLEELYADQGRSEAELAQRMDISDKLREQVKEFEKEKRDLQRRYNEQSTTFEAERQAFYDNEQHLKSRIQTLIQTRKQVDVSAPPPEELEQPKDEPTVLRRPETPKQDLNDPDQEPAEMTSLKLELSTLSTSYTSIQSTLVLLQTQLFELERVNRELQEENEGYNILLRERTLTGQFNPKKVAEQADEDDDSDDLRSLRSTGRSTLDIVEEEREEESNLGQTLDMELGGPVQGNTLDMEMGGAWDNPSDDATSGRNRRQGRNRGSSVSSTSSGKPRGESLADLPITGPGLDLAAELGRAENKDILDGVGNTNDGPSSFDKKARKGSKKNDTGEVNALRTEVKALKDANKALSLYASKIIDRIIAQEGFEHVLAADYEKEPETPATATSTRPPAPLPATPVAPKARPQSVIVGRSMSNQPPAPSTPTLLNNPMNKGPPPASPARKANRRSLSFDWKGFSIFNAAEKKPEPNLRPLTLRPGALTTPPLNSAPLVNVQPSSARKLDNEEDEEDRRERERLNATMKLMGIQPAAPPSPAMMQKSASSPGAPPTQATTPSTNNNRRFSFFGGLAKSTTPAETSETNSISSMSMGPGELTQEALEHAEAAESLAALDAHERTLSADLARGSSGGFTEIVPRASRKRRNRVSPGGSSSGSTVWSAGIDEEE